MLESTRYILTITAHPKHPNLMGRDRSGYDYRVNLVWDDRHWLAASASSPEALGRIVGEGIRGIAESFEDVAPRAAA